MLGQLNKDHGIIVKFTTSEKPKRTKWDFMKISNIINTFTIHYNLVK